MMKKPCAVFGKDGLMLTIGCYVHHPKGNIFQVIEIDYNHHVKRIDGTHHHLIGLKAGEDERFVYDWHLTRLTEGEEFLHNLGK